jgi:hypothetical protein
VNPKGGTVSKGRKEPFVETNIATSQAQENEYPEAGGGEARASEAVSRQSEGGDGDGQAISVAAMQAYDASIELAYSWDVDRLK